MLGTRSHRTSTLIEDLRITLHTACLATIAQYVEGFSEWQTLTKTTKLQQERVARMVKCAIGETFVCIKVSGTYRWL